MGIHVLRHTTLSLWWHKKKNNNLSPPSFPPSRGHGRGVANRLPGALRGRGASELVCFHVLAYLSEWMQ